MDDEKPADVARHQTHFGFGCRGWEAIVLLMGLIALPTSHAPSKSAPNRDPPGKMERGPDRSVDVLNMDLDTLLVEASLMPKPQAAPDVREWLLHRGLPTIEVPTSLLGNQEALTKRGQRKIGVFSLPLGAENYRFWMDPHHRDECPRGDEQISRGALERPPGKPRFVAWAEEYNQRVTKLVGGVATRSDWQQFADDCDIWQQQLAAYRQQWGVDEEPDRSLRDWSFDDPAATARNVLRRWAQYESVCPIVVVSRR